MIHEPSARGPAEDDRDELDATTFRPSRSVKEIAEQEILGLTVLCHPDPDRVGETAMLTGLLSRRDPHFAPAEGGQPRPLSHPCLSRKPIDVQNLADGGIVIDPAGSPTPVTIDGREIDGPYGVDRPRLEAGLPLLLGDRIVVLIHLLKASTGQRPPDCGLVGESTAMLDLRRQIQRLAARDDVPALLRGETGTGKELAAKAIHELGPRRGRPFVAVNVGAIPSELAEAELFGAARGAHSGADRKHDGYFRKAHGGTLFLDEIGDVSPAIQVKLLRALETRQIQPLGPSKVEDVDIRLISATDADLEDAIRHHRFDEALFHRLGYTVELPSLRARRDDVGRLFFHFLRQELERSGEAWRLQLADPRDEPWVPAELVAKLASYRWPGNVRELRNFARDLVVFSRGKPRMRITDQIERLLSSVPSATATADRLPVDGSPRDGSPGKPNAYRDPNTVSRDELGAALAANGYSPARASADLNLSPTSVDSLMKKLGFPRGSDLERDQIEEALDRHHGDLDATAAALEVSKRALVLRMSALGIERSS